MSNNLTFGEELPVLAIRNAVLFPGSQVPFDVGRTKSVALIEAIKDMPQPQVIAVFTQKDPATDDPLKKDLHEIGCAARVVKAIPHNDGTYSLVLQGITRISLKDITSSAPYLVGLTSRLDLDEANEDPELEALSLSLKEVAKQSLALLPEFQKDSLALMDSATSHGALADLVASGLDITLEDKQGLISTVNVKDRIHKVITLIARQLEILKMRERINSQIKEEMGKNQREYVLRQQLKAIRDELGESPDEMDDVDSLNEAIAKANLPDEALSVAKKQVKRLMTMQPGSAEYVVVRTYLDWILEVPWSKATQDNLDILEARKVLDEEHYGLEDVKKRIIEYLAVRKLKQSKKGPILCLVGPPGVGKTSLGKSLARSVGRKFVRISLGGVHDEAAIRGHRRTYIGALPGQIISSMKKAGTINPLFVIDEIDKLGSDYRGDPSSAMLEVLDPEQNDTFVDHYLEIPYDLSNVMFIATANVLDTIPAPLRDRMEIIEIPGYTRKEKLEIAKRHLLPKQLGEHGITTDQFQMTDEAIELVIEGHTREAGVRSLERKLASLVRGVAVKIVEGHDSLHHISTEEHIKEFLGAPRFTSEVAERTEAGVATGLAWTSVGGEILFIEATKMPGTGKLNLTGQLGDVMKESANAALSYVRSNTEKLGLSSDFLEKSDIHIHIPAGAMPKDGPSAGITLFTALVSLLTNKPVRHDVAMTGEISLRGQVLPIGGLKNKALGAHRAGIKKIIMPFKNKADLDEIPKEIRDELEFVLVNRVDEVLSEALETPL